MNIEARGAVIGRRLPKLNAQSLVTGRGDFTVDYTAPGMLYTRVLRSPHPHAKIVRLDVSRARALRGVAGVVTAEDVPFNYLGGSVRHRPLLAAGVVRCVGEPVAAVAAIDESTASAALALIDVEYQPLPALFTTEAAVAPGAPLLHPDKSGFQRLPALAHWFVSEPSNVSHRFKLGRGNVETALRNAPHLYRGSFSTQPVSHVCLEAHAAFAKLDSSGRLVLWCSTGKPFRIQNQVCSVLGLNNNQLLVTAPDVGGDFGNKGETSIEALVALLALKTRRPVKGVFSREEEFTGAGLRIATEIDGRIGVGNDGCILALDLAFRNDIGPYDGYGSMVTLWAAVCASGPYDIADIRIIGESIHTHNLRAASFRGFGNPQVSFARESLIDIAAKGICMDPIALRRRNAWKDGSISATSQVIRNDTHGIGFIQTLDRLRDRFAEADQSKAATSSLRRGVGYASGMHGSGYGCLVDADTSGAMVRLNPDGTFILYTGCHDVGQGTTVSLIQITADAIGVEPEQIILSPQNTDSVPFDNGASASRQLYISGNAALKAAEALRARILQLAAGMLDIDAQLLTLRDGVVQCSDPSVSNRSATLAQVAFYAINVRGEQPIEFGTSSLQGALLDADGNGDPIGAFLFVTQRAEVEVDIETGAVRVLSLAGAHDVGRAINPQIIEGQIQGGLVQGMGYALLEDVPQIDGRPIGPNLEDYLVPMAIDAPEIVSIIVETYEPSGPLGAKGVGEAGLVPTAAAIANAVENATGVRMTKLPITPENLLKAIEAHRLGLQTTNATASTR